MKLILHTEGSPALAPFAASFAALGVAVADLFLADDAVTEAEASFAGACDAQLGTTTPFTKGTLVELNEATAKATDALNLALRADALGGVQ